jgi:hypothetical protein
MTDPLPLPDATSGLSDLFEDFGDRWQISPECDGDGGYSLSAVPRPPVEGFTPVTARTPSLMRAGLGAYEARLAPDLTGPLSRTLAPDAADRVRDQIAGQLMSEYRGWEIGWDVAGWYAKRGHRLLRSGSAVGLGAKLASESGQFQRPGETP